MISRNSQNESALFTENYCFLLNTCDSHSHRHVNLIVAFGMEINMYMYNATKIQHPDADAKGLWSKMTRLPN